MFIRVDLYWLNYDVVHSQLGWTGCAWYWIGRQNQAAHGTVPEMSGWAESGAGGKWSTNSTMYTFYLLAFHSVNPKLANLGDGVQTAETDLELLFSIVAELVAMIVFGAHWTTYSPVSWPHPV